MYGLGLVTPQHPVDVERVGVGRHLEALADHDLEGLAGPDLLLGALDRARGSRRGVAAALVGRLDVRVEGRGRPRGAGCDEVGGHRVEPGDRVGVRLVDAARRCRRS